MNTLRGLNPENVFKFFEEICAVPHGSGNTTAIKDYCVDFAKSRNREFYTDSAENVVIFKNGSLGRENEMPVIIQGHTDMVCQKDETSSIDFLADGLELCVDGDYVHAKGTTLGADNGVAVALMLLVLDGGLASHPAVECLFTTSEEVGLDGAKAFDYSCVKATGMINLDSENEGIVTVSCAAAVVDYADCTVFKLE